MESGYPPYSPPTKSRTLSTNTKSTSGTSPSESDGGEALYFATRKSQSPSRGSQDESVELVSSSKSSFREARRPSKTRSPAHEAQPLHPDDSPYDYHGTSRSDLGDQDEAESSQIGVLPRLVGGSHKILDGTYQSGRRGSGMEDEDGQLDMGGLEQDGMRGIEGKKLRTRAYWRAAAVNVSLILSWCE